MSGNGAGRADARATKKQVETLERKQLALKLVELGARTNIVTSSTGVSDAFARTLFREVHQRSPSQGLATQPAGLLNSPARREAAAAFAGILRMYDLFRRGADASIVELVGDFVKAFHLYQDVVPSGELDVNNAFYLWRYLVSGQLAMPKCRRCRTQFIVLPDVSATHCRVCTNQVNNYCACGEQLRRSSSGVGKACPVCPPKRENGACGSDVSYSLMGM